jgi:hypothetical protein
MADYFVQDVLGKKGNFNKDYKIVRINDGAERWVHGNGELTFDDDGNPIRMLGTIQDITERRHAEQTQQVLLEISRSAAVEYDVTTFIESVRDSLGTVLDTKNFYIALYDEVAGGYTYPVYFDQYDSWDGNIDIIPNSATDYIRRTGESKIWIEEEFSTAAKKGDVRLIGTRSKC